MLFHSPPLTLLISLLALFKPGGAQQPDPTYVQGLLNALQGAGLTQLANATTAINSTIIGRRLLSRLSNGNYTVFAPNDAAFQNPPSGINNTDSLASYIAYHFVLGDFTNTSSSSSGCSSSGAGGATSSVSSTGTSSAPSSSTLSTFSSSSSSESSSSESSSVETVTATDSTTPTDTSTPTATVTASAFRDFGRRNGGGKNPSSNSSAQIESGVYPNVTLGRTLLDSPDLVMLEGNKSQVLAWTRSGEDGKVTILNQVQNITILNSVTYQNLFINVIDGILIPPGNVSTAVAAINATTFASLASTVQETSPDGTNETLIDFLQQQRGITIFVPNDDAFTSEVNDTLNGLAGNQTAVMALLGNHIINGTTLYSTNIDAAASSSENSVSASGEPLSFSSNSTGLFVTTGNGSSAQIVRPDVLIENGVIHVIDRVLVDTNEDPAAASSAYASATSAAAVSTTETGPVGAPVTTGAPTSTLSSETPTTTSFAPSSTTSESSTSESSTSESSTTESSASTSESQATSTDTTSTDTTSTDTASTDTVTATATQMRRAWPLPRRA